MTKITSQDRKKQPKTDAQKHGRKAKLATALRENLKRRKAAPRPAKKEGAHD